MKKFLEPEIEIEKFDVVDVITTSEVLPDAGDDGLGWS